MILRKIGTGKRPRVQTRGCVWSVGNGEAIQSHSLLDAEPPGRDHHSQDLFESTILSFPSFKRNLHGFVRIAAKAKAELVPPECNLSDSEVPANCKMIALHIYAPVFRRFKVPLEYDVGLLAIWAFSELDLATIVIAIRNRHVRKSKMKYFVTHLGFDHSCHDLILPAFSGSRRTGRRTSSTEHKSGSREDCRPTLHDPDFSGSVRLASDSGTTRQSDCATKLSINGARGCRRRRVR